MIILADPTSSLHKIQWLSVKNKGNKCRQTLYRLCPLWEPGVYSTCSPVSSSYRPNWTPVFELNMSKICHSGTHTNSSFTSIKSGGNFFIERIRPWSKQLSRFSTCAVNMLNFSSWTSILTERPSASCGCVSFAEDGGGMSEHWKFGHRYRLWTCQDSLDT